MLDLALPWLDDVVRAMRARQRLVVLAPAAVRAVLDPRDRTLRRHHLHESSARKPVTLAVRAVGPKSPTAWS